VIVGVVNGHVTVEKIRRWSGGSSALVLSLLVPVVVVAVSPRMRSGRELEALAGPAAVLIGLFVICQLIVAAGARGEAVAAALLGVRDVEVRRIRMESVGGETVACVLEGALDGDEVRHGDTIRAYGHRARDGHVRLDHVDVLESPVGPVVCRVQPGAGTVAVRWANRACLALAAAMVAWTATVVVWRMFT
jgi:hypothetical protein